MVTSTAGGGSSVVEDSLSEDVVDDSDCSNSFTAAARDLVFGLDFDFEEV
jgi:hypothetical protein